MSSEADTSAHVATRAYKPAMSAGWWTRKRHYFWYMVREFTALPLALWLLWLLVEIKRAGDGPSRYYPHSSPGFVIFSVICFGFAVYHSITFLSLAGVIIHLKVLDRPVAPRAIVWLMFILWLLASIVIGAVLIGFGR